MDKPLAVESPTNRRIPYTRNFACGGRLSTVTTSLHSRRRRREDAATASEDLVNNDDRNPHVGAARMMLAQDWILAEEPEHSILDEDVMWMTFSRSDLQKEIYVDFVLEPASETDPLEFYLQELITDEFWKKLQSIANDNLDSSKHKLSNPRMKSYYSQVSQKEVQQCIGMDSNLFL